MSVTGGRYGDDLDALINDYPDFSIRVGFEGVGWQAQKRLAAMPRGKAHIAMTLDELAEVMDLVRSDDDGDQPRSSRPRLRSAD